MPYKNAEDKRRWKREHREQRNAQRRTHHLSAVSPPVELNEPDPDDETRKGWKLLIGVAVAFGAALLGALSGARSPKVR
jgi:hypothetical protein